MHNQHLINRINNRRNEQIPAPLFWVGLMMVLILLSTNVMAADCERKVAMMLCESGLDSHALNKRGRHPSKGIAQFIETTFYEFAAASIKDRSWNFKKLGKPDWDNAQQQYFLLGWALDHGYAERWECAGLLYPTPPMDSQRH